MTYDPGYTNTASCISRITYIDGGKGILRYRGYPIEKLAENCTYLEVAYLLLHGELPTASELAGLERRDPAAHHGAREHQEVHGRLPLRCPPHGHAGQHRGGALDVLPRRQEHRQPRQSPQAAVAADRQDAHARRLRLPPQPGTALRLPRQRPQLHRKLHEHALEEDGAAL